MPSFGSGNPDPLQSDLLDGNSPNHFAKKNKSLAVPYTSGTPKINPNALDNRSHLSQPENGPKALTTMPSSVFSTHDQQMKLPLIRQANHHGPSYQALDKKFDELLGGDPAR